MNKTNLILLTILAFLITACNSQVNTPQEGWPPFPPIEQYWVVDKANCFSQESIEYADAVFQQLQNDDLIEVAVICINGVGPEYLNWLLEWGNYVGVGLKDSGRGIVWLIRPDVDPKNHRIVYQINEQSWQTTAVDISPIMRKAVNYANWGNYDGCLETLAVMIDKYIRSEDNLK